MNRNRKNSFLFVVLLSILSLCLFGSHMVKAESASEYVVEIDDNGNLLKGTEINTDKPIIRPAYQGNIATMFKDVIGPKGYFTGFYDPTNHNATYNYQQKYAKRETLLIKNLGQYNGRKIALKITFLASATTGSGAWKTNLGSYILKDGAVGVELGTSAEEVPIQYQLVYDEPGEPVVQNIYLDLPNIFATGPTNGLRHPAINISSANLKKAFIAAPSLTWNQNVQRSYSLVSKMIDTKNMNFFNGEFNTLNNLAANPNVSIVSNNNEPTVLLLKSVQAISASLALFKSDMKVPYIPNYLPMRANGEGNSDKLEAKYDIGQAVVDAYPNYLPDSLKIVVEDTEGYFTNLTPEAVTFTDKNGKEITNLISVGEASNGKLEMTLSKASLEKLKSNQVNIKISFDELNLEKLLSNYNVTEKRYKVPLTFYNVRNVEGKEDESEKTKVEASISPNIYGEAKPTKVSLGSSASDLKVMDLIKNGVTTIPNDSLKLSILGSQFFDEFKTYTVNVKIESTETPSLIKIVPVPVQVEETLEEGWEVGTSSDFILDAGYKIEWMAGTDGNRTSWWYTYQGKSWMYSKDIEAGLLVNGVFPTSTSDVPKEGFLWTNGTKSEYSINRQTKSLKRTFLYLTVYKIEIIQQMLENHAIGVTYRVTNLNNQVQKIGVSQYVDVLVGSDSVPVTPINNFKGINLTFSYNGASFVIIPDQQTMPNWVAGPYTRTKKMQQYDQQNANGVGWETGKQYRTLSGDLFNPPVELKENQPVNIGDSAISMKNGGVSVMPKDSVSFKQILKFGNLIPPKVTLDQTSGKLYNGDTLEITGTISDEDNLNYRLYLEMDNPAKTLIPLGEFSNVPYNQVQSYQATIKGEDFTPGKHDVSIIGIDEYGMRSLPQKLKLDIFELNGTPIVQKIELGKQIPQTNLSTLVKDVKGDQVKLKESLLVDSSKVGFQWVDAILIDRNLRELAIKLPVNVYNPESTVFNDKNELALDAPDVDFDLTTVRQAEKDKRLNEVVTQKVNPTAWDITNGLQIDVSLIKNGIKPIFGTYPVIFEADNGEKVQKEVQISVGGELTFKELPSILAFKKSKLGWGDKFIQRTQSDWKIEIENTIGSNWFLKASASPFENQAKEQLKHSLIFKNQENKVMEINSDSQVIAVDAGEIYPVIQWENTGGLLVKLNPAAKIGIYQGEITWELTDAP